jgi:hypothetical protein
LLRQALVMSGRIEDESHRAKALSSLSPYLPAELISEALKVAKVIRDDYEQVVLITALAEYLGPRLKRLALSKALARMGGIVADYQREEILSELSERLPEELLLQALTATKAIENEGRRKAVLAKLGQHLPMHFFPEAFAIVNTITDSDVRASAIKELAPYLPSNLIDKAFAAVHRVNDAETRMAAMAALFQRLPVAQRQAQVSKALADTVTNLHKASGQKALLELAPLLSSEQLRDTLTSVGKIKNESQREAVFSALMPYLPSTLSAEALALTRTFSKNELQANVLGKLAPDLSGEHLDEAFSIGERINRKHRYRVLFALAPHLYHDRMLAEASAIEDLEARSEALVKLFPFLPIEQKQEILLLLLVAIKYETDDWKRARIIEILAPSLSEGMLEQALATALEMGPHPAMNIVLGTLAPLLPPSLIEQAFTTIKTFPIQTVLSPLYILAPFLSNKLLFEALATIKNVKYNYLYYDSENPVTLVELARYLPPKAFPEILSMAVTIDNIRERTRALILLCSLDRPDAEELIRGAIYSLIELTSRLRRPDALSALTRTLDNIIKYGGQSAAKMVYCSIDDICDWYP